MVTSRSNILRQEESTYHCVSRCVRRCFLQGFDAHTGRDFSHRKVWVRERLVALTRIFTIDVLGYALMDTHTHTLVRTRPDKLETLSDEEVIERWLLLYPRKSPSDMPRELFIELLAMNKTRVAVLRGINRICKNLGIQAWAAPPPYPKNNIAA